TSISNSAPSFCANADGSNCDFYRQITLNGQTAYVSKRSIVLVFDATTGNANESWNKDQTVYLWAVDDGRPEGTRVVTASHSVIQPVCNPDDLKNCFDGAVVRNVEVTIYDNDTPAVLVTPIDPNTGNPDNNNVVLEGWGDPTSSLHPITEQVDKYTVSLASDPGGTVVVDLSLSDLFPDPSRLCLTSDDPMPHIGGNRFNGSAYPDLTATDPTTCPSAFDPTKPYKITFDSTNWFVPVVVTLHSRNDSAPQDPHNTTITHTIDPAGTGSAKYLAAVP